MHINGLTFDKDVQKAANEDTLRIYYDTMSEVPHDRYWKDGQIIGLANGVNWDMKIFERTNDKKPDGGRWLNLNITTSIFVTDW